MTDDQHSQAAAPLHPRVLRWNTLVSASTVSVVAKSSFGLMALALAGSAVGFGREAIVAASIGASSITDSYVFCWLIPSTLLVLIGTGAWSPAIIGPLTTLRERQGEDAALQFEGNLLVLGAIGSLVLTLTVRLFADNIVSLLAPGLTPSTRASTVWLLQTISPSLGLLGVALVTVAILSSRGHNWAGASASLMFNLAFAVGMVASDGEPKLAALANAILVGSAAVSIVALVTLLWRDRGPVFSRVRPEVLGTTRKLLVLMAGTGVYLLVPFVERVLASSLPAGSLAVLNFAGRASGFAYGILATGIPVMMFPRLTALVQRKEQEAAGRTLAASLVLTASLAIPASAWMIMFGLPLIQALYERGAFGVADTVRTAAPLAWYSMGLFPQLAVQLLARGFYAQDDMRTPTLTVGASTVANLAFDIVMTPFLGYVALAIGFSAGAVLNAMLLMILAPWRHVPMDYFCLLGGIAKVLLACAAAGILVMVFGPSTSALLGPPARLAGPLGPSLILLLVSVALYCALLLLLFRGDLAEWLHSRGMAASVGPPRL